MLCCKCVSHSIETVHRWALHSRTQQFEILFRFQSSIDYKPVRLKLLFIVFVCVCSLIKLTIQSELLFTRLNFQGSLVRNARNFFSRIANILWWSNLFGRFSYKTKCKNVLVQDQARITQSMLLRNDFSRPVSSNTSCALSTTIEHVDEFLSTQSQQWNYLNICFDLSVW